MFVLASGSAHRAAILRNAGLDFAVDPPNLDERAAEAPLREADVLPEDLAAILAEAKSLEVSERRPELVLGGDQVLALDGEPLHKVADMEAARRRLLALSGRTHHLHSALVLARGGEVLWRHVSSVAMTMRTLDPAFVGRHLAAVGDGVLSSVGAYQIEGPGVQLFERIEGDFFTIIGVPLLPLLAELRRLGEVDG